MKVSTPLSLKKSLQSKQIPTLASKTKTDKSFIRVGPKSLRNKNKKDIIRECYNEIHVRWNQPHCHAQVTGLFENKKAFTSESGYSLKRRNPRYHTEMQGTIDKMFKDGDVEGLAFDLRRYD